MSGDVAEFVRQALGRELTPWQQRMVQTLFDGDGQLGDGQLRLDTRPTGRLWFSRFAAEANAQAGQHVHVVSSAGTWCLTRQPAGFLYALVRPAGRTCWRCGRIRRR